MPTGPDTTFEGYQEGDKVGFLGGVGTILSTDTFEFLMQTWPITVKFESGRVMYFTQDGHLEKEFTGAKLVVLERGVKRVKKWRWVIKNKMDDGLKITGCHYPEGEQFTFFEMIQKVDSTMIEEEA